MTFGFLTQDSFLMEEDGFLGRLFFDDGETGTFWIVMKWDLRLWEVETQFDCGVVVGTWWPHDALFLFDTYFFTPSPSEM